MKRAVSLVSLACGLVACGWGSASSEGARGAAQPGAVSQHLMANVAVGGASKTAEDTARLRELFAGRFATSKGGRFDVVVDMDDKSAATTLPTKDAVRAAFADLAARVAAHRRDTGEGSSVLLALTAHGVTKDGVYKLMVAPAPGERAEDAYFTGDELVPLIASVGAEELIAVFQSCESGTLVDGSLTDAAGSDETMGDLGQYLQQSLGTAAKKLAVVVPVNGYVLSSSAWTDVLAAGFTAGGDVDGDGWVGFGELRDQLTRAACAHPSFAPKSVYDDRTRAYFPLPTSGVDPRFFETGEAGSIPLFAATDAAAGDASASASVCEAATEAFAFRFRKDVSLEEFFQRYASVAADARAPWTFALAERALAQDGTADVRAAIVDLLVATTPSMGTMERADGLAALAGAGAPLASSNPAAFARARDAVVQTLRRNDRLAIEVDGLERIAPSEVYGALRKYAASSDVATLTAALRKLDAAWDVLVIPPGDYRALRQDLDRAKGLLPAGAAPLIDKLRGRMG